METLYEHYSLYQQFCSFSLRLTVFSLAEVLFLPFYFDMQSFFMKSFTPTTRLSSSGTNILSNDLQDSYYLVSFQFSSLSIFLSIFFFLSISSTTMLSMLLIQFEFIVFNYQYNNSKWFPIEYIYYLYSIEW